MPIYMIEWWNVSFHKYEQEYFVHARAAFVRFLALQRLESARPEIRTVFLNDADYTDPI